MCRRPKRRASTEQQPAAPGQRGCRIAKSQENDVRLRRDRSRGPRWDDRFTRPRSGNSRKGLVAPSNGRARLQPDDAAAEHSGVDRVRARPEQAECRAPACTGNHRDRDVAAGQERGRDGRGGEHECDDPCAKPKRKGEPESGRHDYGGVWRELWRWQARDDERSNPRASQSQQHQRNSDGAVRITRQEPDHHHHDTGWLRRR